MRSASLERLLVKERDLGADLKFEDIIEEVAGVYPRIMKAGEMDAGAWSCGMVAGLIHDIPTCQELIEKAPLPKSKRKKAAAKKKAAPKKAAKKKSAKKKAAKKKTTAAAG